MAKLKCPVNIEDLFKIECYKYCKRYSHNKIKIYKVGIVVYISSTALERLKWKDLEFEACLGYKTRYCQKLNKQNRQKGIIIKKKKMKDLFLS